jgi:uncharacterized membrane protein
MSDIEITPVEPIRAERPKLDSSPDLERERRQATSVTLPPEFLAVLEQQRAKMQALTTGEVLQKTWNLITKLLPILFTIITSYYMGNWKGIIAAVVGLIASITAHFGFDLSAEVTGLLTTIFMFLLGLFIKAPGTTTTTPETGRAQ